MPLFTRGVSVTNFFVASSALAFQAFVLYPWHKRLDEDFEELKKENKRVLTALQELGINERKAVQDRINELRTKDESGNRRLSHSA
ncbi:hypothetical protein B0J11DRAFT_435269 [Dendryphion nanum]|uniref:Uncharacterized protein n=1 Tax=Dendryphion nanum TaxID=256645 RepID=A0A9P9DQQ5_9PLEO|nr:hypothetical protein B0J11DRAFT_435269 [Dendryphion nanum]